MIEPKLFIYMEKVRVNISRMSSKAKKAGTEFRPHFKTHQSKEIGRIFREFGVSGITVSSLKMASYFISDGWDDVTIAFPANVLAAEEYNNLAKQANLKTLITSPEVIQNLDAKLTEKLGLYIEIDPDYGRSGVSVSDHSAIEKLVAAVEKSKHCYLSGFYCHAGHTYPGRSEQKVAETAKSVLQKLEILHQQFPNLPICYGDTPSCSVLEDFGPATQLSPGNFVFYDWMQVQIGACSPDEIAVDVACPVIATFPERQQVLIHGGAVHFSKEAIENNEQLSFGKPILNSDSPQNYLKSVSQEHGILQCSKDVFAKIKVGDIIKIFPIHSCLTANFMRAYHTETGAVIDHMNGCF